MENPHQEIDIYPYGQAGSHTTVDDVSYFG